MNFGLTPQQEAIVASVRRFRERELMALEPAFLERGCLLPEERTALEETGRTLGLWALEVPSSLGGRGFSETEMCLVSEEIYKHPAMFKFGGSPEPCLYSCTDEQRQRFLLPVIRGERRSCYAFTEPGTGSDFSAITTGAERDGDGWLINGEKSLVAYVERADFIILFAKTDRAAGARGITCFLVDRDTSGVEISPPREAMGDDWITHEIRFTDVRVSDAQRLGRVGGAWAMANDLLNHGRLRIAAYQLGIAARCLEIGIEYAKRRTTWGKPLAVRQAIQWMLVDAHMELDAARLLVYRAAWQKDHGRASRSSDLAAKLYATEMAQRVTDCCLQVLGGIGYLRSSPVQSFYRQVRVWRIGHGSSEISRWMIARELLGAQASA